MDLVKQLRKGDHYTVESMACLMREAATEIERLTTELDRWFAVDVAAHAELSRLTLSAAESQREVDRLKVEVAYRDKREEGEIIRAEKAEAERDKYRLALQWIAEEANTGEAGDAGVMREAAAEALHP